MDICFVTAILPTVLRFAFKVLRDDDLARDAATQAWFLWNQSDRKDIPAGVWARVGVLRVRTGRDLPFCGTPRADALNHAEQGAGMDGLRDREPQPLDTLIRREELAILKEVGPVKRKEAVALLEVGWTTTEVAALLGLSKGRVSMFRREAMESIL